MSNALQTAPLLDAIRSAILAAWGTMPISYGMPRTPIASAPYAVIYWDEVRVSFTGFGATFSNPAHANTFTIIGRFPFPSDPTEIIDLQRVSQANALIAQLQTAATFAGVGMNPLVTKVDGSNLANPNEKVYELRLTFEVLTQATHH